MKRSPFITVEGVDGSGKSSHVSKIVQQLKDSGWDVVQVREPGGTSVGEEIRPLLLESEMEIETEILLAFASRAQLLSQVIRPALARGAAVVCDRFTDSTYAYQVGGGKGSEELVRSLESQIHANLEPDLTFLFDLPVEISKQRLGGTGKVPDKFESKNSHYFEDVRAAYLQRAGVYNRFCVIDSSQPLVQVAHDVEKHLRERINQWRAPARSKALS